MHVHGKTTNLKNMCDSKGPGAGRRRVWQCARAQPATWEAERTERRYQLGG